nr:MAG TPA: hypothetical protein [Caudoviricetes sp.]
MCGLFFYRLESSSRLNGRFFCAINPASLTDSHCSKSQKINSF